MKKVMKIALEKEQIQIKNQYTRFDGYEIHLHGNEKDDFSLYELLNKPVYTVHYPISRCDVFDVVSEIKTPYFNKVIDLCKKTGGALVVHGETDLNRLLTNSKLDKFIDIIKQQDVTLYVENCYRNVGAIEGLNICNYLKERIGDDKVYPLLDTCHLIMSSMSFKFAENSFYQTMDNYYSDHFVIHLNDCIGSGEKETGGIHGTNFYANQYLLSNILWKLHVMTKQNPNLDLKLVLEVDEVDYNYPTNADILAKNIDKYWNHF